MNPATKNILVGTALGGVGGGVVGYNKGEKNKKGNAIAGAIAGGFVGGSAANYFNIYKKFKQNKQWYQNYRNNQNYQNYRNNQNNYNRYSDNISRSYNYRDLLKTIGATGSEQTKSELKKKYRDMAFKHHPDRGGNEEIMKSVNTAWDNIQKDRRFQKLAMPNFFKGFTKAREATQDGK